MVHRPHKQKHKTAENQGLSKLAESIALGNVKRNKGKERNCVLHVYAVTDCVICMLCNQWRSQEFRYGGATGRVAAPKFFCPEATPTN